ncbi:hypothetical protein BH20ACT2_BH20ACT2_23060 [soil metagenome]
MASVLGLLALLFLVVPIAELYVIVQVAQGIGVGETILVLIAVSVTGAWLVKREGVGLLRRIQAQLAQGQLPHREVIDGGLVLGAGALMLTPGFLTDIVGLLFLLPPTRALARNALLRRFRHRIVVTGAGAGAGAGGGAGYGGAARFRRRPDTGRVVDADASEVDPRPPGELDG